jgi:hypothetical protein
VSGKKPGKLAWKQFGKRYSACEPVAAILQSCTVVIIIRAHRWLLITIAKQELAEAYIFRKEKKRKEKKRRVE